MLATLCCRVVPQIADMSTEADKEYLKRHQIPALFNELTQELFRERPENPVEYLLEVLKAKRETLASGEKPTEKAEAAKTAS